jgi:C-5 cytosine-specific DNA methylase
VKPLAIDLFCGLGGWTEGLLSEGYDVVGFDIERHQYGEHRYPAQLVIQDVLTLNGSQFKDAALIVASPPCQEYSYMAMPWKRAKDRAAKYRSGELDTADLNRLFDAAVRIGREAGVPTVIENVRGAQPWVGRSRWNYGSYHLWGDVPALMPMTLKRGQKVPGFRFDGSGKSFQTASVDGVKVGGLDWSNYGTPGYAEGPGKCFRDSAIKNEGGSWFAVSHNNVAHSRGDGIKCGGSWFGSVRENKASLMRRGSSGSRKRKMASAMIAKIPLALSRHIAKCYHPGLDARRSHGA